MLLACTPSVVVTLSTQRFDFKAKVGEGGFAEVWKAWDRDLSRWVAIKLFEPVGSSIDGALAMEHARALARVDDQHVVRVYDIVSIVWPADGEVRDAIVMELLDGPTLAVRCEQQLAAEEADSFCLNIFDGLAALHRAGIAHADLHLGNVMLHAGVVKILDVLRRGTLRDLPQNEQRRLFEADIRHLVDMTAEILGRSSRPECVARFIEFVRGASDVASVRAAFERAVENAAAADLGDYLRSLLGEVSEIVPRGLPGGRLQDGIERVYTPLRGRQPEGEPGDEGESTPARLTEILCRHRHLLVVGRPGSGKTTFIRLVLCMLVRDHVQPRASSLPTWREEFLDLPGTWPPPVPALVHFRDLMSDLNEDAQRRRASDRGWLLRRLAARAAPAVGGDEGMDARVRAWERRLVDGAVLLVLEGLDEIVAPEILDRALRIVGDAVNVWRSSRIVVTSRPIQLDRVVALGFVATEIEELTPPDVDDFARSWSRAARAGDAEALVLALRRRELAVLIRNPMMLTFLCALYNDRSRHGAALPSERGQVYGAIVGWMLGARALQRCETLLGAQDAGGERRFRAAEDLARTSLEVLALTMMGGLAPISEKTVVIDVGEAAAVIEPEIRRCVPDEVAPRRGAERWLVEECALSSILEEGPGHQVRFWHLTFQEYFAAAALARHDDWWRLLEPHLDDPQWEEVVRFASTCFLEKVGQGRVNELLEKVLSRGEGTGLAGEARTLVRLSWILAPMAAGRFVERPSMGERRQALMHRVRGIFDRAGARQLTLRERIAAAEAIGRWQDEQVGVEAEVDAFLDSPGNLRLAMSPVTVRDFARFVQAGGYGEVRWWDADGWTWRAQHERSRPRWWEPQLERPSRPVVGVSWHEAQAYCRWLGARLGAEVRLPRADELESLAAVGASFPWGDSDPDDARANFDRRCGGPTPVGLFPEGAGPFGHLDLAGNVWQWCVDGPPGAPSVRWLKGGCWFNQPIALRRTHRHRAEVGLVNGGGHGFRVGLWRSRSR